MAGKPLVFRVHAIERMAQRGIGVEEVRHVLDTGEVLRITRLTFLIRAR
jgi:hypothetical protein